MMDASFSDISALEAHRTATSLSLTFYNAPNAPICALSSLEEASLRSCCPKELERSHGDRATLWMSAWTRGLIPKTTAEEEEEVASHKLWCLVSGYATTKGREKRTRPPLKEILLGNCSGLKKLSRPVEDTKTL